MWETGNFNFTKSSLFGTVLCILFCLAHTSPSPANFPQIPTNDHSTFLYFAVKLLSVNFDNSKFSLQPQTLSLHTRAINIARLHDLHYLGSIGELDNWFLFAVQRTSIGLKTHEEHDWHFTQLSKHEHVDSVSPQIKKRRLFKRDGYQEEMYQKRQELEVDNSVYEKLGIFDPGFVKQWHLLNRRIAGNDLNITPIWQKGFLKENIKKLKFNISKGLSGKNVTVCFVDDGLDYDHPDLKDNFFAEGSYDFNDHRKLPTPTTPEDHHGTRCAGEVAAKRNSMCGVGIAWDARISGVRILSGELTEADEAASINYAFQENQIYSCSWGPADNGRAMDAPPKIVADAFRNGIENGRGGLGSIYVFATGNGGGLEDNCNFDGYTNSIFTITVGAITEINSHPTYSEACSAQLIVAYSSGYSQSIYTSDWPSQCTDRHGGTSAAAPLVSGILALVLEIRPDLTWRDIQHILVETAQPITLEDVGWFKTNAGRLYNHKFGFGKIDGAITVEHARTFKNVNKQTMVKMPTQVVNKVIPQNKTESLNSMLFVSKEVIEKAKLQRLEHVTVTVTIEHERRGDVQIDLVSPHGIVSKLATVRPQDTDTKGFNEWTFMSVAHWEEYPVGEWKIIVSDHFNEETVGKLISWTLILFGEYTESSNKSPDHLIPYKTFTASKSITLTTSTPQLSTSQSNRPSQSEFAEADPIGNLDETWNVSIVLLTVGSSLAVVSALFAALYLRRRQWIGGRDRGDGNYEFVVLGADVEEAFEGEDDDYDNNDEERVRLVGRK
ncbi:pheromone processing endoprotease [Nowakowskiella sp. JEL0078]|nr:pheromone processing endoprotease [Nowakowskiella sp. JEL0078]